MKKALIVQGGWQGHEPKPVADILAGALREQGFEVEVADTLDAFKTLASREPVPGPVPDDIKKATRIPDTEWGSVGFIEETTETGKVDLVVPEWTMGRITGEQLNPLLEAIRGGVGAAGVHGGMGDAFRDQCEYQFMVGGQWVAHPGGDGVTYQVHIEGIPNPITKGLKDFSVTSEQYYMHVDPGNTVLATTKFGDVVIPVVWTKYYGKGRVFYCSLGHKADVVRQPEVLTLVTRGMLWAAGSL